MADGGASWEFAAESLRVRVLSSQRALGQAAAAHTAEVVRASVRERGEARVVMATGNSQLPFVKALVDVADVPWHAVTVFHMDEYVGIGPDHPASFQRWIAENLERPLAPARVHYLDGRAASPSAEAARYEDLLREKPIDLVCMGIGENGHLAFNEPYQADFADERWARVVSLDDRSRKQQVDEGHFAGIESVPETAISLTVPALLSARSLQVAVPERRKAEAVRAALTAPVDNSCPATALRRQGNAVLFLDPESASLLDREG
ncbi:glucosamine-6-phosphate deaminase [Tenggerimyces flavus]|uniref:Glucosamine-6-phosphate deaminase n=1 Tax=Tenggerimyces flavus TaxID=1708749 RepID=A0ABV7YJU2_9ACTN|nr:glucosamine-6-phosphate deaminase [Tenggerimyces flavus]MBM7789660.1 glucosamine-6-phosphate deaminase [Tenggerimyces flavus]